MAPNTKYTTVRPIANKYCEGKLKQNSEKRVKHQNVKLIRREQIKRYNKNYKKNNKYIF
jgi:hypothetical protein